MTRLERTQTQLAQITDTLVVATIDQFLCDLDAASAWAPDAETRKEIVFAQQHGDDVNLGVYLDKGTLKRFEEHEDSLADRLLVYEAISHFQRLCFAEKFGTSVSQLELEFQADIDKWALLLFEADALVGFGVHIVAERTWKHRAVQIRRHVFEAMTYLPTDERSRYETASDLAMRVMKRFEEGTTLQSVTRLRRFYRLSFEKKRAYALSGH